MCVCVKSIFVLVRGQCFLLGENISAVGKPLIMYFCLNVFNTSLTLYKRSRDQTANEKRYYDFGKKNPMILKVHYLNTVSESF